MRKPDARPMCVPPDSFLQFFGACRIHQTLVISHDQSRLDLVIKELGIGALAYLFPRLAHKLKNGRVCQLHATAAILVEDRRGNFRDNGLQQRMGFARFGFAPAQSLLAFAK